MTTLLLILVAALLLLGASAMTNLAAAAPRQYRGIDKRTTATYEASGALWAGAFVEEDVNGQVANLTATGTTFTGILLMSATAAGDRVEVADKVEVRLTINKGSGFLLTDHGATVYAGDGGTDFNLTSTSRQAIGKIVEIEPSSIGQNSGFCWVYVEGNAKRSL